MITWKENHERRKKMNEPDAVMEGIMFGDK